MKLLTSGASIRQALKKVAPTHVAVAYIGADWRDYLVLSELKQVVISPTLGSNPRAIRELAELINWRNVHFLDRLHSKFYIGSDSVLFGSCNLSTNAMGDGGLHEIAAVSRDSLHIETLQEEFRRYVSIATKAYPTKGDKEERLAWLEQQQLRAEQAGLVKSFGKKPKATDLADFGWVAGQRIHISWWTAGDDDEEIVDEKVVRKARPKQTRGKNLDTYYSDILPFLERDNIREGDWVLQWECKKDGKPAGQVKWLYVNDVIADGALDKSYPKIALEIEGQRPSSVPFDIKPVKSLIIKLLRDNNPRFEQLRPTPDMENWSLPDPDGVTRQFIEELKRRHTGTNSIARPSKRLAPLKAR